MTRKPTPRRDPTSLPDGCDLYESKAKGLTIVISPAAQAAKLKRDPSAALRATIPWDAVIASARRCRPEEFYANAALSNKISHLEAWAAGDARKIKRLCDILVRADAALAHCGVGRKAPVRVNINSALEET